MTVVLHMETCAAELLRARYSPEAKSKRLNFLQRRSTCRAVVFTKADDRRTTISALTERRCRRCRLNLLLMFRLIRIFRFKISRTGFSDRVTARRAPVLLSAI